ncbi:MAG: pyridoxal-phosphate dependent enzyme [Elusimicrobia bacterium]|nr:pyridoxal-phosphate dependent enzyme [Elusimicrobiota bacterium]
MGKILNTILERIGRTPLVKLNKITKAVSSNIYAKIEYLNPGGSVKDRISLAMIEKAEKAGILKPGATIVEATAGNTGAGLAIVCAVKGYKMLFVVPDKMSAEKIDLLKAYGAEVIITKTAVPPDSPENYNMMAERLSREVPGAFRPNQFGNPANPKIHYLTTGPEIWEDTGGKIDALAAGAGTGGTISGAGKFLKEKNPNLFVVGADPEGSILSGDSPKPYKVEGIGEDFFPDTYDKNIVDEWFRIIDKESFETCRRLAREEGLLVGGSSGTAVAAALKYAAKLKEPEEIVVICPDTGRNYLTKIFSDEWMKENGYLED